MSHHYACHVRFSDVDVFGHVNNVKYFEYYQEARLALLSALRTGEGFDLSLVVAQLDVDYKRPLIFRPEPYAVTSRVVRVGRSSLGLEAVIGDGETVLSRSQAVLVAFDLGSQRSRPWDPWERVVLEQALEG